MDVFDNGTATVGGAPINVAFHVHQLLQASGQGMGAVVSAVGDDVWGAHILHWLEEAGLSTQHVSTDALHPTGIATVFVRNGEAGYDIEREVAWDQLADNATIQELARECSAVAFGSLAQREEQSGVTIRRFVESVNGQRLYDVNLRVNATDGARGYSAEILRESCRIATIVKANSGEMDEVMQLLGMPSTTLREEARLWEQMEQMRTTYGLYAVVVTRGPLGAMLLSAEGRILLANSTLALEEVHPVGAGDAFSAGLLYGLSVGCGLAQSARIADKLATWVTQSRSATPAITTTVLAELRDLQSASTEEF